jgi:hypothetical protein
MEWMRRRYLLWLLLAFGAVTLLIGFGLGEKSRNDEMPKESSAPNKALSLDIPKTSFTETNQEPGRAASPGPTTLSEPTLERPAETNAVPGPDYSPPAVARSVQPEPPQETVVPSPNALSLEIPTIALEIPSTPNLAPDLSAAPTGMPLSRTPLVELPTPSLEAPGTATIAPVPNTPMIRPLPNTPVAPVIELPKSNLLR